MGVHVCVRFSDGSTDSVHFAGPSGHRQQSTYGCCWHDCVTYGPDDDEVYGPIRGEVGWYRPRTARCIRNAEKLLQAIREKENPTEKTAKDGANVSKLLELLRRMKTGRKAMMSIGE